MDLQHPENKMSKSADGDAGIIYLLEDPTSILKKFRRAVTDSDNEVRYDHDSKPGISNLLDILSACTGQEPANLASQYSQYGQLKSDTGDAVVAVLDPIRQRAHELIADKAELSRLLLKGSERARAVASATLHRAYDAIGLLRP